MNPTFIVTFGIQYRDQAHPSGRRVHPDGYVAITAEGEKRARQLAEYLYAHEFAFIYPEGSFNFDKYPLGELEHFIDGQGIQPPEQITITANGKILLLPDFDAMSPAVARALAATLTDAAERAEGVTRAVAEVERRISTAGEKRHDDMF
jgi:hypothetical protein